MSENEEKNVPQAPPMTEEEIYAELFKLKAALRGTDTVLKRYHTVVGNKPCKGTGMHDRGDDQETQQAILECEELAASMMDQTWTPADGINIEEMRLATYNYLLRDAAFIKASQDGHEQYFDKSRAAAFLGLLAVCRWLEAMPDKGENRPMTDLLAERVFACIDGSTLRHLTWKYLGLDGRQ